VRGRRRGPVFAECRDPLAQALEAFDALLLIGWRPRRVGVLRFSSCRERKKRARDASSGHS